jgi:hypothetical protein
MIGTYYKRFADIVDGRYYMLEACKPIELDYLYVRVFKKV